MNEPNRDPEIALGKKHANSYAMKLTSHHANERFSRSFPPVTPPKPSPMSFLFQPTPFELTYIIFMESSMCTPDKSLLTW